MRRKKMSVASVCKTIPVLGAASFLPFMCTDLHEQVQKWLTLDFNLGAFKFAFIKQDKIKLICVTSSQISNCNKKNMIHDLDFLKKISQSHLDPGTFPCHLVLN